MAQARPFRAPLVALALFGPALALPARAGDDKPPAHAADDKKPAPAAKKAPAKPDASASATAAAAPKKPAKAPATPADKEASAPKKPEASAADKDAPPAKKPETATSASKKADSGSQPAKKSDSSAASAKKSEPTPVAAKKSDASGKEPSAPVAKKAEPAGALPALESPDPRHGQGTRKIEPRPTPPVAVAPSPETSSEKASAHKGAPPKHPAATLPPGSAPRPVDFATRRQIAGGATSDELKAKKDDPELSKLLEAERVLFPRPLTGMAPGWSWELPEVGANGATALDTGLPPSPSELTSVRPSAKEADWLRGLAVPNLPVRYDERLLKYLKFFRDSPSGSAVARVWAKKSGRYEAAVRGALAQAGLPTDLVWLSLIESGHNPNIVSPAGAVGLWQFMPETARTYGLTVDRWVDERQDPERETQAAVRYLADLYHRYGSWDLAMAAYNMGHGGLSRAIKKFNTNDFWELARHEAGIPWETTLYVPKILATAIVMNNKRAFGLDGVKPDAPESFDVVQVGPGLALADIARAAGVEPSVVEGLNPMYVAGRTPPLAAGRATVGYAVRLPRGAKPLPGRLLALETERDELSTYVVKQGDTVASVAKTNGASETSVRSLNRIGPQEVLVAGTPLIVPKPAPSAVAAPAHDDDVVVIARDVSPPPDTTRVFYPVATGDSLDSIAAVFGVARADLLAWNALDAEARLQDGMVLQVFPKRSQSLAHLRHLREGDVKIMVAGTPEFIDHFEGLNGKRRLVVMVRQGDTLASIGRRYDTSVGWMERINRRSRTDELHAGESVVVYADRSRYPMKSPPAGASGGSSAFRDGPGGVDAFASFATSGARPLGSDSADEEDKALDQATP
jgi:membrane-bound lytic murein transglycosylase D